MFDTNPTSPVHELKENFLSEKGIQLFVLREDLNHEVVSGNKWRKLKYNLLKASEEGYEQVLTFGGAYSNHIVATAFAAKQCGLQSIGVIRGEEQLPLNPTLKQANEAGMTLQYVSRERYREKNKQAFLEELRHQMGPFYLIPEGGSNGLAVKGCTEIITSINRPFDVVCCACGTGGTMAGLIAHGGNYKVLGFPALKGAEFLKADIESLLNAYFSLGHRPNKSPDWQLIHEYHFGGYAKLTPELVNFVRQFKTKHQIELDLIYTGKMMFGLYEMIKNTNQFNHQTIVAVHTGGVQGNKGFEERLGVVV